MSSAAIDEDPLLAFASEEEAQPSAGAPATAAEPNRRWTASRLSLAVAATAVVTAGAASTTLGVPRWQWWQSAGTAPAPATLTVTTRPEGAQVFVDGEHRGATPMTLPISPGAHTLLVRRGAHERVLSVTAVSGSDIVRDLDMPVAPAAPTTGALSVVTDPPGARVSIDGRPAGHSPVTVDALTAGEHRIAVAAETGSAERSVTVRAGQTAAVVFSLPRGGGPVAGWLSVSAPFDVQVVEGNEVIGASGAARIMIAAGSHDIVLANPTLEYQEARRIDVAAGQTTLVTIDPPQVTVNVNARPWADVTVDGQHLGQTPIANAVVTVGMHEFVFRHPQLGERRQTVAVASRGAQRISVDLTR